MQLTKNFINKYNGNQEMMDVIRNAKKVLSPYFQDDQNVRDREILYETIYGFKLAVADGYQLSMEKVYDRIYHLEKVSYESQADSNNGKSSRLGYFTPDGNIDNDKQRCSTITIIKEKNINLADYRETLTHELVHLFSQEYFEDENRDVERVGRCGLKNQSEGIYLNEVMTQKIALDILGKLNYKVYDYETYVDITDNYAQQIGIISGGRGYCSISQTGNLLKVVFDKNIHSEMFDNTYNFTNEIKSLYDNGQSNPLNSIDLLLKKSFKEGGSENYIQLYKELSDVVFQKIDKENLNVADYANIMNNINKGHGCALFINNNAINIFDSICVSREIEHFYKTFNKDFNPETDLEKEINPFTRSKDCTNFLIVMQALKTNNMENDFDKIKELSWKEVSRNNDNISLIYNYNDIECFISVKKDLSTGLTAIQQHDILSNITDFKKPSLIEKLRSEESELTTGHTFSFISKYSKISDYSDVAIKNAKEPESLVIHALATKNHDMFKDNISNVNINNVFDSDNSNLFHVLAQRQNKSGPDLMLKNIISPDNKQNVSSLLNMQNNYGQSPVDIAILNQNFSFLETACDCNLSLKNADKYNNVKVGAQPLIHYLQDNNYYSSVEGLIKGNYNVNTLDKNGDTILHRVMQTDDVFFDKKGIINALIQKNTNSNIENLNNLTPLMELCKMDYPFKEDVKYLCDGLHADPNYKNHDNRRAIHYLLDTCVNNENGLYKEALSQLIKEGADVNVAGKSFVNDNVLMTPLQIATGVDYFGQPDKVLRIDYNSITILVENGADINKSYGDTPSALEMAHLKSDINMFKSFIDGGVNIEKLYIGDGNLSLSSQMEIIQYSHEKEKEKQTETETNKNNEEKIEVTAKDIAKTTFILE